MRIIYVTASMPYGPGETFLVEEVQELRRRGHQVLIVPRSPQAALGQAHSLAECTVREDLWSGRVLREGVRASCAAPVQVARSTRALLDSGRAAPRLKNLAILPKALWLARMARDWGADHIHCHWAGTTASMALAASAISGVEWSFTAHRWDIVENNALAAKAERASFVRVISKDGSRLMSEFGIPPGKVRVLHMGVRIPRSAAWAPPAWPVVLCPANLVAVKGHRYLIQAWRLLRERGVNGELWIAGDGALRASLERLAAILFPPGRVKFLGRVDHDRLMDFYRSGEVSAVVLASLDLGGGSHEGIPVALMEAMSYGVPVVATASGAIPELVNAGTGVLVEPADAAALAAGLQQALNPDFARGMGALGRRHVMEHHNVDAIAATLEGWFAGASGIPAHSAGQGLSAWGRA